MKRRKFPKSIRKHIAKEKARIRREYLDIERQREEIRKVYRRFLNALED